MHICIYVCMKVCQLYIYTCMKVCMFSSTCVWRDAFMYVGMYIYVSMPVCRRYVFSVYTCACVYLCVCVCVCVCVCTYACMYVRMSPFLHISINPLYTAF